MNLHLRIILRNYSSKTFTTIPLKKLYTIDMPGVNRINMNDATVKNSILDTLLDHPIVKDIQKHEITFISKEKLTALEKVKESIPTLIEKAISDYKKAKLAMLHEKDKKNPAAVNARVKKYNEKHKDEINAKRLMKRNQVNVKCIVLPSNTTEGDSSITKTGESEFTVKF